LITAPPFLRAALVERAPSCGKPTCRGQRRQLHRSLYLAGRHHGQQASLYVPRALEETARPWVDNGRRLRQQLQDLHQLQLRLRKQQLSEQPTTPTTDRPDRSPG
jgi:hypothetical protein